MKNYNIHWDKLKIDKRIIPLFKSHILIKKKELLKKNNSKHDSINPKKLKLVNDVIPLNIKIVQMYSLINNHSLIIDNLYIKNEIFRKLPSEDTLNVSISLENFVLKLKAFEPIFNFKNFTSSDYLFKLFEEIKYKDINSLNRINKENINILKKKNISNIWANNSNKDNKKYNIKLSKNFNLKKKNINFGKEKEFGDFVKNYILNMKKNKNNLLSYSTKNKKYNIFKNIMMIYNIKSKSYDNKEIYSLFFGDKLIKKRLGPIPFNKKRIGIFSKKENSYNFKTSMDFKNFYYHRKLEKKIAAKNPKVNYWFNHTVKDMNKNIFNKYINLRNTNTKTSYKTVFKPLNNKIKNTLLNLNIKLNKKRILGNNKLNRLKILKNNKKYLLWKFLYKKSKNFHNRLLFDKGDASLSFKKKVYPNLSLSNDHNGGWSNLNIINKLIIIWELKKNSNIIQLLNYFNKKKVNKDISNNFNNFLYKYLYLNKDFNKINLNVIKKNTKYKAFGTAIDNNKFYSQISQKYNEKEKFIQKYFIYKIYIYKKAKILKKKYLKFFKNKKRMYKKLLKANRLNKKNRKLNKWKIKAVKRGWIAPRPYARHKSEKKKFYLINIIKKISILIIAIKKIKIKYFNRYLNGIKIKINVRNPQFKEEAAKYPSQRNEGDGLVLNISEYFNIILRKGLKNKNIFKPSIKNINYSHNYENKKNKFKIKKIINNLNKAKYPSQREGRDVFKFTKNISPKGTIPLIKNKIYPFKEVGVFKKKDNNYNFDIHVNKIVKGNIISNNYNDKASNPTQRDEKDSINNKIYSSFKSTNYLKLLNRKNLKTKDKILIEPFQAKNFVEFVKVKNQQLIINNMFKILNNIKNNIELIEFNRIEKKYKVIFDRLLAKARYKIFILTVIELFKKINFFKFTKKDMIVYPANTLYILYFKKEFELILSNFFEAGVLIPEFNMSKNIFKEISTNSENISHIKEKGYKKNLIYNYVSPHPILIKIRSNTSPTSRPSFFDKKAMGEQDKELNINNNINSIISWKNYKINNNIIIIHSEKKLDFFKKLIKLYKEKKQDKSKRIKDNNKKFIQKLSKDKLNLKKKYSKLKLKNIKNKINYKLINKKITKTIRMSRNKATHLLQRERRDGTSRLFLRFIPKNRPSYLGYLLNTSKNYNYKHLYPNIYMAAILNKVILKFKYKNVKASGSNKFKLDQLSSLTDPKGGRYKRNKKNKIQGHNITLMDDREGSKITDKKKIPGSNKIETDKDLFVKINKKKKNKFKLRRQKKWLKKIQLFKKQKQHVKNLSSNKFVIIKRKKNKEQLFRKLYSLKKRIRFKKIIIPLNNNRFNNKFKKIYVLRKYPTPVLGRKEEVNFSINIVKENKINMVKWIKWRIIKIKKFEWNISTVFNSSPVDVVYLNKQNKKTNLIQRAQREKVKINKDNKISNFLNHSHLSLKGGKDLNIYKVSNNKEKNKSKKNLPIIHYYLKSMSIFNRLFKGSFVFFNKIIGFNFNPANNYNNNKLKENIYKFLFFSFKKMFSLISKPVFVITPDKIVIHLFYFILIPSFLKNKSKSKYYTYKKNLFKFQKYIKYLKHSNNASGTRRFRINGKSSLHLLRSRTNKMKKLVKVKKKLYNNTISNNKLNNKKVYLNSHNKKKIWIKIRKLKKKFKSLNKIHIKNRVKLNKLVKISLIKMYPKKFEIICNVLSKFLQKKIELNLIRLHYPFYDSHILANYLALIINKIKFVRLTRKIYKRAIIKRLSKLFIRNKYNIIPSFLTGLKMKVAGRLMNYKVIPRKTIKFRERGSSSIGTVNYTSFSRINGKNRRGAYSITISSGQNFF